MIPVDLKIVEKGEGLEEDHQMIQEGKEVVKVKKKEEEITIIDISEDKVVAAVVIEEAVRAQMKRIIEIEVNLQIKMIKKN